MSTLELKSFLDTNYDITIDKDDCLKAVSLRPKGKRIIYYNPNGNWLNIREDGDTRTVYYGIIDNLDEFVLINHLY